MCVWAEGYPYLLQLLLSLTLIHEREWHLDYLQLGSRIAHVCVCVTLCVRQLSGASYQWATP